MSLRARGFRNLGALSFEPGSHFNVIHGDNGAGKSNLLEAIYYLGALKGFRGGKTDDLIALDASDAFLEAAFESGPAPHKLRVDMSRSQRRRPVTGNAGTRTRCAVRCRRCPSCAAGS